MTTTARVALTVASWTLCLDAAAMSGSVAQALGPDDFGSLVRMYRIDSSSAVQALLRSDIGGIRSASEATPALEKQWSPTEVRAAAMLRTDAGLHLIKAGRAGESAVHFEDAARLIDEALLREPAYPGFTRRWYSVVDGLLRAHGAADIAAALAARTPPAPPPTGDERRARDAYERGLQLEIAGAVEGPLSPAQRVGPPGQIDRRALGHFATAAVAYEKAAARDDAFEAHLHLGRVLMLRISRARGRRGAHRRRTESRPTGQVPCEPLPRRD